MADDDLTRKFPAAPFPIWPGNGEGIPDHDGIANRELEIPRFPIRPQIGSRGPAGGTPGISWSGPPAAPHANTATRGAHCGPGAPSTLDLRSGRPDSDGGTVLMKPGGH